VHGEGCDKHYERYTEDEAKDYDRGRNLFFVTKVLSDDPGRNQQTEREKQTYGKVNADKCCVMILSCHGLLLEHLKRWGPKVIRLTLSVIVAAPSQTDDGSRQAFASPRSLTYPMRA
jgi:hypothetical protein